MYLLRKANKSSFKAYKCIYKRKQKENEVITAKRRWHPFNCSCVTFFTIFFRDYLVCFTRSMNKKCPSVQVVCFKTLLRSILRYAQQYISLTSQFLWTSSFSAGSYYSVLQEHSQKQHFNSVGCLADTDKHTKLIR